MKKKVGFKIVKMTRVLLVQHGCPGCLEYLRVIPKINLRLPIGKKIKIIDCSEWENFGLKSHPIMDKFNDKDFQDYPLLYLDGILIIGVAWSEQLKIFLEKYLEEDFIF